MSENRYLICFCPWSWAPGSLQARDLSLSSLGVSSRFSPRPFGPENRAGLCSSPKTPPMIKFKVGIRSNIEPETLNLEF